jgi:LPXTG-site transpeptidase (sortase) family protein
MTKKHKTLILSLTIAAVLAVGFFVLQFSREAEKSSSPTIFDSTEENIIGAGLEENGNFGLSSLILEENPDEALEKLPYGGGFTLPNEVLMQNGSSGKLTIPRIGVYAGVFENEDVMEAMSKGVAHFPSTSNWNGNVGLSAHNWTQSGIGAYFKSLKYLAKGDEIIYETALGKKTYIVSEIREINVNDWSLLGRTDDNRLTLITCVNGKPDKRLCLQAAEKI